ncbi:MAG: DUF5716 family protein [Lachnospira sp.]
MEDNGGLILGIELNNTTSQIYYFDSELKAAQPCFVAPNQAVLDNPVSVEEILAGDEHGQVRTGNLEKIIRTLLYAAVGQQKNNTIKALSIVPYRFDSGLLDAIKSVIEKIGINKENWQVISRQEAFAYYAFTQKKELYNAGVALMDYGSAGIEFTQMIMRKRDNTDYIISAHELKQSDSIVDAVNNGTGLDSIDDEITEMTREYFERRAVSSVYLTGKGFDVDELPFKFKKEIVSRKKAFIGQNLYVKGACISALETANQTGINNTVLLCDERIKVGIETDIVERGNLRRLRIVRPGMNWYMARRSMDFIIDDVDKFVLKIISVDNRYYEEVIDISDIPFREGKTTRIQMDICFMAADRCLITIKDLGFGEFFKSSGKVIYKELEIKEN